MDISPQYHPGARLNCTSQAEWRAVYRHYEDILCRDPIAFVTEHAGTCSEIFHDQLRRNWITDLYSLARGLASVVFRSLCAILRALSSVVKRRSQPSNRPACYLLILTVPGEKYRHESEALEEAATLQGLTCRKLSLTEDSGNTIRDGYIDPASISTIADALCTCGAAARRILHGSQYLFTRDQKARNLYAASVPGLLRHAQMARLARRIVWTFGHPEFVFSLLPTNSRSLAVVGALRDEGVKSFSVRTQSTSASLGNTFINTDVVFAKSRHELELYRTAFSHGGPSILEGCLLSLPADSPVVSRDMRTSYALVLGTAPSPILHASEHWAAYERAFRIATHAGQPIVFKAHNLGEASDGPLLERLRLCGLRFDVVYEVERNRELIDGAEFVVAVSGSTLLYYVLLLDKPVAIVDVRADWAQLEEFWLAPIPRVTVDGIFDPAIIRAELRNWQADVVARWLRANYFLDKGTSHMIETAMTFRSPAMLQGRAVQTHSE